MFNMSVYRHGLLMSESFGLLSSSLSQNADGEPIEVNVKNRGDGVYSCSYTPTSAIKHTVAVTWAGINVPESPFRVSPPEPQSSTVPPPTNTSASNLSAEITNLTECKVPEVKANLVASDLLELDGPTEPYIPKRKPIIVITTYMKECHSVSIT